MNEPITYGGRHMPHAEKCDGKLTGFGTARLICGTRRRTTLKVFTRRDEVIRSRRPFQALL